MEAHIREKEFKAREAGWVGVPAATHSSNSTNKVKAKKA
jgi:hypothetical protein